MSFSNLKKFGLLPRVIIAIALGIGIGLVAPAGVVRAFVTFNGVFGNFIGFLIPLIIFGLVTPAIAGLGRNAGRMLLLAAVIAYGSSVCSGLLAWGTGVAVFPRLIDINAVRQLVDDYEAVKPYFTIDIPPLANVMSTLVLSFTVGLGMAAFDSKSLSRAMNEFRDIIASAIAVAMVPLLPLYIMGIFMEMASSGQAWHVLSVFFTIISVIFILHIALLLAQYLVAGAIARRNPLRALWTMLPAYVTALGTSSSAATIPVTLRCVKSNGVRDEVADFVVPLCATIHLSGSAMKITACATALIIMQGTAIEPLTMVGFIMMLGVMMVAAPGVPGGAIMAALGVLDTILGFTPDQQALMIALYITMDSFGTACNVTGDGAIALVINRVSN
ncbi:MAG: dicarboxylate/amino acid:cation symporter [Muribaculaceae bacterium]|nr:dicarboxylate/amino acid:cation symporter [Muribaculaceae bacterium]